MQIEDGTGSGRRAKVNSVNMLSTESVTASVEHYTNHADGQAYHLVFDQTPTAGGDCFLYMQNTADMDMVVEGIWLSVSAAAEIYVEVDNAGTRNAATVLVPVNCNRNSGNAATGVFEGGNDLDGGAATLAGGIEFERYVFRAATSSAHFNFEQDLILGEDDTLTIWSSANITINGTVVFNYHVTH